MTEPSLLSSRATPLITEPITLDASVSMLTAFARRHRKLILGTALAVAAGTTVYTLVKGRTYTATTSFMSQSKGNAGALGGLAAQFGIALPADMGGDSPQFYVDLITSREILDSVVTPPYALRTPAGIRHESLAEVYGADVSDPPARQRAYVIRKLREHLSATIGKQTGVVNLSVTTRDPYLSQAIAARILDQINSFNLRTRQSRATAERAFTEGRLAAARADLASAENRLEDFMQGNRDYRAAPRLALDYDRLSRDVSTKQALVTTLTQAFEQAKIEEVRDTPVITVLDSPEIPPVPDPLGLVTKIVFSLLLGALVGMGIGRLRDWRARA